MTQTFKHGDRVTCTILGIDIEDARISINANGEPYICCNDKCAVTGFNADDKLGYKYSWMLNPDFTISDVTNLRLATHKVKTWETLEVGDEVTSEGIVLEVADWGVNKKAFIVCDEDGLPSVWTIDEFIESGYTIVQPTPKVEKRWFVNTKLEPAYVHTNDFYSMEEMKKREAVGNAFATEEEARGAAGKMREAITTK